MPRRPTSTGATPTSSCFLTRAYNGQPEMLIEAVAEMFRIRDRMVALIRNPIPGLDGVHAAPTFELTGVTEGARA